MLLPCCCPVNPHRAPQTPREKARPFQRIGFLCLYNVIGAAEKRGHRIYGNYIKFMESWQARSRKGLQDGGGHFRMEKAMKASDLCVETPDKIAQVQVMPWDCGSRGRRASWEQLLGMPLVGTPLNLHIMPVRDAELVKGRLRQRYFESHELAQGHPANVWLSRGVLGQAKFAASLSCVLCDVSHFRVQKIRCPYPILVWDSSVIRDFVSRSPGVFSHRLPSCGSALLLKLICAQIRPLAVAGMEVKPLRCWL